MPVFKPIIKGGGSGDLTIEGQQIVRGILTGTVDEFDTVYSKFVSGSNWDTVHNKLSNPSDLPTGTGYGVSFSSDSTYLAIAYDSSPYLTVYKRSGDTFTKLTVSQAPAGRGRSVSFSSDSTYLAVAHIKYPYLTMYKRSGDTFAKINISAPPYDCFGVSFSSDATYLAVAHGQSPRITVYKRSGDTFNKLSNPSDLPTGTGNGVSFSSDDAYLAVGHETSPYLTVYKRSGDTFTKLSIADLPPGDCRGVSFSSDSTYLAVTHYSSPYLTMYKRSGDTFTKLSIADLPPGDCRGVSFSSDDAYLAVTHYSSPYLTVYKHSGDEFTKLSGITAPAGTGFDVSFSSDDTYLAVAHATSPYLTVYKTTLINPATLISPALNTFPLGYDDIGYAKESGVENDEIEMVSIFRGTVEEERKTVTPNFSSGNQIILPNTNKVLSQVTLTKPDNLIPENILKDKNVCGVVGIVSDEIKGHTASFDADSGYDPNVILIYLNGTTATINGASGDYSNVVYIHVTYAHEYAISPSASGATLSEFKNGFWLKRDVSFYVYGRCLTGDTLITLSDNSVKRIDELQLTDDYLSYDLDTGELVKDSGYRLDNLCTRSYEKMADRYIKCTFDDGTIIKEVHGHRFFNVTKGEFIYLMFWEIGDRIYKMDGTTPKLIAKETIYEPVSFYSVSTKNHHNGFANGCLYGDRHTQKYEINLVDGKPLQNKDKPTDISIVWRERKLQEDKTKSWNERGKSE